MGRWARVGIALLLFVAAVSLNAQDLAIVEREIRVTSSESNLKFRLPINSNSTAAINGRVELQILDFNDLVVAKTSQELSLPTGNGKVEVVVPAPQEKNKKTDFPWYRLKYSIIGGSKPLTGTVALGACMPDLFALTIIHPREALEGKNLEVRVRAANPVTQRPVAGVAVNAQLDLDTGPPLTADAVTGKSGEVVLSFALPRQLDTDEGEIKFEATKGVQRDSQEVSFDIPHRLKFVLSTDKLLYQPGQDLHSRVLILDETKRALASTEVEFTLSAPDDSVLFHETAKTNEYGIANVDWQLPASVRLGDYNLEVELADSDRYSDQRDRSTVKISRYELPQFAVTAKSDRTYYLPGQDASIEVSADYLFGKPVTKGTVKLVRETERSWNYKDQKWETTEEDTQSGVLDSNGRSKFNISLAELHGELADQTYRRFQDHKYVAYVTDQTTGRTEQRRFDLRASRDPIHIYISKVHRYDKTIGMYVATFAPDGTPVQADLDISQVSEDERRLIGTAKTSKYGIARVDDLQLPFNNESSQIELAVYAHAKNGAHAEYQEDVWSSETEIALSTDHAIYKAGQPLQVSIRTSKQFSEIILALLKEGAVLSSRKVRLRNGRGFVPIQYDQAFRGEIQVVAYTPDAAEDRYYPSAMGAHAILFPDERNLTTRINFSQNSYRPGELAQGTIRVSSPAASERAALGIVVVDKAVEERARTDEEFGGYRHGFWDSSWRYESVSLGGLTRADLDKVDLRDELPSDYELAAEYILNSSSYYQVPEVSTSDYHSTIASMFGDRMRKQLEPIRAEVLQATSSGTDFPTNNEALVKMLSNRRVDLQALRDPWDSEYSFSFSTERANRVIGVTSLGPDKVLGTSDDIRSTDIRWNYFSREGAVLDRAVRERFASGGVLVRDIDSLEKLFAANGVDLKGLRDPWDSPYTYRFNVSGSRFLTVVLSHGPRTTTSKKRDDFIVWSSSVEYFSKPKGSLADSIASWTSSGNHLPRTDTELDACIKANGVPLRALTDPWGHSYFATYARTKNYADRVEINYSATSQTQDVIPVTRMMDWIYVWSAGPDGTQATADDVQLAAYSQIVSEQSGADLTPKPVTSPSSTSATGAVEGVVTDQAGAVMSKVNVKAIPEFGSGEYTTKSDSSGRYLLRDMKSGLYRIEFSAPGFMPQTIRNVPVHPTSVTAVNVVLSVGAVEQTVEVSASPAVVETTASMVAKAVGPGQTEVREPMFTPRVRDYFPETLYWAPSVLTDGNGKAKLQFKLADNITTWKVSVLASTKDGSISFADKELKAFQPFFVDHDPPRVLTVGDYVELPVVVRNYLASLQSVRVEMKPSSWFSLNQTAQQLSVPPSDSATALFPMRATAAVDEGKQQVTAANSSLGDAVSKSVRVHPNGREESVNASEIVSGNGDLDFTLPGDVISGSQRTQLRVFPNLAAELAHSMEATLERPHGCGEQTISSTYPSLMLLRVYKKAGESDSPLKRKADKYLHAGYLRLLDYRDSSGGFTYWGRGNPDVALTAYALRFLRDVSEFIEETGDARDGALKWLVLQQRPDGSWQPAYGSSVTLTSYVLRIFSAEAKALPKGATRTAVEEAVRRGSLFMSQQAAPEPYVRAELASALYDSGDIDGAKAITNQLRQSAHREGSSVYWSLDTNTPFYGWGRVGRIESTAVVLTALSHIDGSTIRTDELTRAGIKFLMKERDKYGVWYSGQTTVNVLDTLISAIKFDKLSGTFPQIAINGHVVSISVKTSGALAPVYADVTDLVRAGSNSVKVSSAEPENYLNVQVSSQYYVPWTPADRTDAKTVAGDTHGLRIGVKYDKTALNVREQARCEVQVERFGHRGYGMLIAEVGLPPAAEVDRSSLEKAMNDSGWTLSQYDILPDRIVLYLWPNAGGSNISFTFRPRMAIDALTAPSRVYDYYNPDSQTTLAPTRFRVTH